MNDNSLPKISIMIPTYNQEKYIAKAIESVLIQDYKNIEIIVSDDCSTDGTSKIIESYLVNNKIKYFRNEINIGRIKNYRKSLYERVTGEWVLNLDGDDYLYESDVISYMVTELQKNQGENIVAIMGSQYTTNLASGVSVISPLHSKRGLFEGVDVFLDWDKLHFGHLAILYNVPSARMVEFYRLDTVSSDWESVLRLIMNGKVIIVQKIIAVWNLHGGNISNSQSVIEAIEDYSYIEENYKYALNLGIDKQKMYGWHRSMVKFHTNGVWNSNVSTYSKISDFLPFVVKNYPFAILELLQLRSMVVNMYPKLFYKIKPLLEKYSAKRRNS